jgi:hypothetical protein
MSALLQARNFTKFAESTGTKKTPWSLVRKRTILTELQPLVGEM